MSSINGLEFMKSAFPKVPYLRFSGSNIGDYQVWKNYTRKKLFSLLGFDSMRPAPLRERTISVEQHGYFTLKKVVINTMSDLSMPFYIIEPLEKNGRAAIAIHGHGSDGKEGLVGKESPEYESSVDKFGYTYAYALANKGYTVFVPDLLGAGERTLGIYKDKTAECNDINNALISFGMCLQGVILFENMRLVEYISKTFKEIVCCGFSGGGFSALWLAAMTDRVSNTIISGFFHSFKDTLIYTNRCGCNFIPNLWKYVDMGDILALAAPKSVYIETGNEDKLNGERGVKGVREQLNIANNCYKYFGKTVPLNICEGGHKWYGSYMDEF